MASDFKDRGKIIMRSISRRGYSSDELARKLCVSKRTIRRYMIALQEIHVPITITFENRYDDNNQNFKIWRIEKDWARAFLKDTSPKEI